MGLIWTDAMLHGYLCAFAFFLGAPLGSVALLMLNELIPGRWATPLRSTFGACARTMPLMVLLAIPPIAGAVRLYGVGHWANATDPRAIYLSMPFFYGRAGAYLLLWLLLTFAIDRGVRRQLRSDGTARYPALAAAGVLVYGFTISFAAVDWLGALDHYWYSSAFGLYVLLGQVLLALSLTILTAQRDATETEDTEQARDVRRDMGTVLLAFVALHAYIGFSQFLIIWNGNLPHEISWYVRRTQGIWLIVPIALGLLHFGLPFVLLLSRNIKGSRVWLSRVCITLIAMRLVEVVWFVLPTADRPILAALAGLFCWVGVGAIWWALFMRQRQVFAAIGAQSRDGDVAMGVSR
jgi:hypothetical protein